MGSLLQWNFDLMKSLGTGKIRSLNRGLVILRFFFIYFNITGAKNTVGYIEVFVKSRFHCTLLLIITCKHLRKLLQDIYSIYSFNLREARVHVVLRLDNMTFPEKQ